MTVSRTGFRSIALGVLAASLVFGGFVGPAAAADVIPQPVELPPSLTLDQSVQLLRTKSLDLLIAEAAVRNAEGDVGVASFVPNPALNIGYGRVLNYDPNGTATQPCPGCSADQWTIGITDQAAIEDSLSGKRDLRLRVANRALAAARLSRNDALRQLEFQVKSAYANVVQGQRALTFAKDVQATNVKTLALFQARMRSGAINDGDLARIETQKLEADQAVDSALETLRQARVALAFLLGVRGPIPDFGVDEHALDFSVPPQLNTPNEDQLLRQAFDHRPDLAAQGYQRASAEAAIALARRLRFPDISISAQYTQTGTGGNAIQPPTISFGLSAPIPVFYQQQGEIKKAEANYDTQSLQQAKTTAQVVSDVGQATTAFNTQRALVERMEKQLMPSARRALQSIQAQVDLGKQGVTVTDLLDAQRTYIATNVEYLQDLANYWTAVYQLEEAVGMELHQ
jgi:cobalt-zinc-cadmium efflux system outer membrane protein